MNSFRSQKLSYYRQISAAMAASYPQRMNYIRKLNRMINGFIADNNPEYFEEVISQFGTPEELAELHLEQHSPDSLRKQARVGIVTIVVILIFFQIGVNIFVKFRRSEVIEYEEYIELYGEA